MSWPTPVDSVTVTISGVTYEGTYYVQSSMIYVQSSFGTKAKQVGGAPRELIAKMLLSELVRAGSSRLLKKRSPSCGRVREVC
jgi:hypothetical protein